MRDLIPKLKAAGATGHRGIPAEQDRALAMQNHRREEPARRGRCALLTRDARADAAFDKRVRDIVNRVRRGGDRALSRFAERFDGATEPLEVSKAEMRDYASLVAPDVRRAIRTAARNIARVAARQIPKHWDLSVVPGVSIEQRVEPLARVGCYVPGGRFPLPSSLLMTAVPARVAGVREVIVMCPRPEPAVMAAALEAGVTRMFRIGGAHAIAALAYGTARVPRVDKIVGPGNRFVAAAKACVAVRLCHRLLRGTDRDRHRRRRRTRRLDRGGSRRPGRARSRRAIDLHHVEPRPRRPRVAGSSTAWPRAARS